MTTVFIDGESGTTGLRLRDRLLGRTDIELLSLSAQERRSTEARRDMMKQADITVLCLPDGASREAVSLAEGTGTRLLDASSAHRTEPGGYMDVRNFSKLIRRPLHALAGFPSPAAMQQELY